MIKLGLEMNVIKKSKSSTPILPQEGLIFDGQYSDGQLQDLEGSSVTIYYPDLTDNGDGTYHIETNYSPDNGHIGESFDYVDENNVDFSGNTDYEGGNAIAPYCIVKFDSSISLFDDTDETIWDASLQTFNMAQNYTYNNGATYFDNFSWEISALQRANEFIRSVNALGWMLFVRTRDSDGCIQQIVGYHNFSNCALFGDTDDVVTLDSSFDDLSEFSLEIRYKPDNISTEYRIIGTIETVVKGFLIFQHASGDISFGLRGDTSVNKTIGTVTEGFNMIKVNYDGNNLTGSVNGIPFSTSAVVENITPTDELRIGGYHNVGGCLKGLIDYTEITTPNKTYRYDFRKGFGTIVDDQIDAEPGYPKIHSTVISADLTEFWQQDNTCTPSLPNRVDYTDKILKAVKDTKSDPKDYALFLNKNSAMVSKSNTPSVVGENVAKVYSISNNLIATANPTEEPTLQADGSLFFGGREHLKTEFTPQSTDNFECVFSTGDDVDSPQYVFGTIGEEWLKNSFALLINAGSFHFFLLNSIETFTSVDVEPNTEYTVKLLKKEGVWECVVNGVSETKAFSGYEPTFSLYIGAVRRGLSGAENPLENGATIKTLKIGNYQIY